MPWTITRRPLLKMCIGRTFIHGSGFAALEGAGVLCQDLQNETIRTRGCCTALRKLIAC